MLTRSTSPGASRRGRQPPVNRPAGAERIATAFVPLETKLHAPPFRPGCLSRPRLVDRLRRAPGPGPARLILVAAPVGYGKTTLLAEWRAQAGEERAFAWVSLDPGDDDPARFWRYVLEAIRHLQPGFGE